MAITRIGVQPVITSVGTPGLHSYRLVEDDGEPSALEVGCTNDLSVDGNVNFVHWQGEAALFRVQKARDGGFVQIGETDGSSFVDDGSA